MLFFGWKQTAEKLEISLFLPNASLFLIKKMVKSYSILTILLLSITNVLGNNLTPTQTQEKRQIAAPTTITRPSSSSTTNASSSKSTSISVPQTAA